jgi:phage FluMu protein Com
MNIQHTRCTKCNIVYASPTHIDPKWYCIRTGKSMLSEAIRTGRCFVCEKKLKKCSVSGHKCGTMWFDETRWALEVAHER